MARLYPDGHPYGRRTKGSIDDRREPDARSAARAARRRFAPSELTAVIVGDVEPARVHDVAARVLGDWRHPAPPPVRIAAARAARHDGSRVVVPMMNKAQADIAYGFVDHRPQRSGVLRVLADEQRVRAVLDRRPARRQHSRTAGHGLLRVVVARRERRARAADDPRRRQPGERRSRNRVDRRGDRPPGRATASRRRSSTNRASS